MCGVAVPPRCLVVTGLPGSGKSLWLKRWLDKMAVDMPGARCAVLIAGEGNTRLDPAAQAAGHELRHCRVPACLCCMDFGILTEAARGRGASGSIDWLALEIPLLLVGGFLTAFDRDLGWSRQLVVCRQTNPANSRAGALNDYFFNALCERAMAVIDNEVFAQTTLVSVEAALQNERRVLRRILPDPKPRAATNRYR
jgi:hypothetical protein